MGALVSVRRGGVYIIYFREGSVGEFKYDVALSFSSEQSEPARQLAARLRDAGYGVFFYPMNKPG